MPLRYKLDVLAALKNAGFTTYRLKNEKILAESTVQKLRKREMVSTDNLSRICRLLNCQPGDIIEYVPDADETPVEE